MNPYLILAIAFLVTYFTTPLFRGVALRWNILDFPGGRKIHKSVTPLFGGAGIYLGFFVAVLLSFDKLQPFLPILIGATVIFLLGLINDMRGLSVRLRLFFQFAVALYITFSGARVSFLPSNAWGDFAEIVVSLIWIVGVTNAYNYLDGLDGLAAGSAVVNLLCYGVILYKTGQYPLGLLATILIASCLGFLPYNFRKNKIFMGEAGSTFLGFLMAGFALVGNWASDNIVKLSIPILILGVPIFDMIFTTVMRIREAKVKTVLEWLRYGDKDHFHHYLVDLGFKSTGAVLFIYCITLSLGMSAIAVSNGNALEAFLTLFQAAIIFCILATLIVIGKRHHNTRQSQKNLDF